jgi:hypothetical protein
LIFLIFNNFKIYNYLINKNINVRIIYIKINYLCISSILFADYRFCD